MQNIYESTCFELTTSGEGKIIVNEKTVELPFILPGEKAIISSEKKGRKTYYNLEELKSKSSSRKDADCNHFTKCGGCLIQHMDDRLYKEFKKSIVTQALIDQGIDPFLCSDPIFFGKSKRRRTNLDGIKKENDMILGFHKFKRHSIVDVKDCIMLHPDLFRLLNPLRGVFMDTLLSFQKVKVFMLISDTGIDIGFEIQGCDELSNITYFKEILINKIKDFENIARIFFRHRKKREVLYLKCEPKMNFAGELVDVDAYTFVQACKPMDDFLLSFIKDINFKSAIDLFCGIGTMTIPLSKIGKVIGYELDDLAVNRLNKVGIDAYKRDLFEDPVKDFKEFDLAVINPPRAGALNQVNEIKNVDKILYLSCNPKTMARDLKVLIEKGYKINTLQPIDQFFGSPHIECLAFLSS